LQDATVTHLSAMWTSYAVGHTFELASEALMSPQTDLS